MPPSPSGEGKDPGFPLPSGEARRALLSLARRTIAEALGLPAPERILSTYAAPAGMGAFVTLRLGGGLRGCIGRMESQEPLEATIAAMARAAAFEDPRFPPLEAREYGGIDVEITLLAPMRRVASPEAILVGRHGVHLQLGFAQSVFLPQVAVEQGWDLETLLTQLARKAGLPGNAWRDPRAILMVFEGFVFGEEEG